MNIKILNHDHCKVFHLQPRAFISVRLRDVVTVTISGTGRTLDSGPWLMANMSPIGVIPSTLLTISNYKPTIQHIGYSYATVWKAPCLTKFYQHASIQYIAINQNYAYWSIFEH